MESIHLYNKKVHGHEDMVFRVVNKLAKKYNASFEILTLPIAEEITSKSIKIRRYAGRTYNDLWSESDPATLGGHGMGLELSREIPLVIKDLASIDISLVESDSKLMSLEKVKFDFADWLSAFISEEKALIESKVLNPSQIRKARDIFSEGYDSQYVFNNGDFYPRNFISSNGRIILVDWQPWTKTYRANIIDYIESILSFCFVHMWNNHPWQLSLLKNYQETLELNPRNFQKALLIKAFQQAQFWGFDTYLGKQQTRLFTNALDTEYVQYLVRYTR